LRFKMPAGDTHSVLKGIGRVFSSGEPQGRRRRQGRARVKETNAQLREQNNNGGYKAAVLW